MEVEQLRRDAESAGRLSVISREELWRFLRRAEEVSDQAAVKYTNRLVAIVIVWAVAFGIAHEIVTGGGIAGFSVGRLGTILPFFPLLLAILFYDQIAASTLSNVAAATADGCYAALFPEAEDEVAALSVPITPLDLEDTVVMVEPGVAGRFLRATKRTVLHLFGAIPVIAIIQSCVFVARADLSVGVKCGSILLAAFVTARAIALAFATTLEFGVATVKSAHEKAHAAQLAAEADERP